MHLFLKIYLFVASLGIYSDFYSYKITTIDGTEKSLSVFKGRKILVVILPVSYSAGDIEFLKKVDSISKVYQSRLAVLAVPSIEDGYDTINTSSLHSYYSSFLGQQVTISSGVYTRKTSGLQDPLFYWLTHGEKNLHFDTDADGVGCCFYINEQGELLGEVSSKVGLTPKVISRLMQ
jgi:glutathione peroxidase-family protein